MLEDEKVAKTENLRSALCGISEFEENEKKCVCLLYNCLQLGVLIHIRNLQNITHFFSFSSNSEIPHKALLKFSVFATFSVHNMT